MRLLLALVCTAALAAAQAAIYIPLTKLAQSGAVTGQALVWASAWTPGVGGISVSVSGTSGVVIHNLNSLNVSVAAYDPSGFLVIPATLQIIDANRIQLSFDSSFTGRIVIK